MINNKIKQVAQTAARDAGQKIKKIYNRPGKIKFTLKSKHQPVTQADKLADKMIIKKIRKNFPDHDILSEETGSLDFASHDYLWIIDPVDGTTNFTIKNPIFSVSIALAYRGEVIYGVIYAPVLDEFYVAEKGKGAWLNGKKIKVSSENNYLRSFHTYCYGSSKSIYGKQANTYQYKLFLKGCEIRQLGAATIEFARVAAGITESIVIPGAHSWDVAVGMLLVREAGGKVTDFKGKEWNLKSRDIIATNGKIHNTLLKYL